jgi:catechol-2,3-dioxygenase
MRSTKRPQPQGSIVPAARAPQPIDPNITIGHVHLRTADIDRVRAFQFQPRAAQTEAYCTRCWFMTSP